ncbi:inorganic diphosphatase [Fimbriimonas ginsengisoli]|uniref:inorganic diphosphatase n=1 Tax=Fimbriimonas ginsengisoli Gsoil 348 TaxID=661478 RepID=A0A068NRH4_FIMGI|nr:inorganic diphosphatase [Fimbriimonas ginsengisoli]AIE86123.1 inorganic diphosphatase [Fimbriimonas ginsengisoli Gsoil 348]
MTSISELSPYDDDGTLNVVIETPQGSRNKLAFDEKLGLFRLKGVLPAGHSFPFDFGFIPSTAGEDGDPLDVLVLMDAAVYPGCLVPSRLIGVIEAEQTERGGKTERNDRLIAVAANSRVHETIKDLGDLSGPLLDEIEHFFISYNEAKGKQFCPKARRGHTAANRLVEAACRKR